MSMKIKIHKTNEDKNDGNFRQIAVGDVFVEVEHFERTGNVWLKVIIPLKDSSGSYWEKDTYVSRGDNVNDVILRLFREVVGTALFNANQKVIMEPYYAMKNFADWEKSITDDTEAIAAVALAVQGMYGE